MTERRPQLDGLRGLAVLLVMLCHFLSFPARTAGEQLLNDLAGGGWIGVDLFFVLSGYLISGIVIDHAGPGFFRAFYGRRALRIVPAHTAYLLVMTALIAFGAYGDEHAMAQLRGAMPWLLSFMTSVRLALPGWRDALPVPTWHLWSVSVEEQFYLLWPVLLIAAGAARLRCLVVGTIVAAFVVRVAVAVTGASATIAIWTMPARMDALAIGALLAALEREGSGLNHPAWERWSRAPLALWAGVLAVVLVAVRWVNLTHPLAMRTIGLSLIPAACGALLAVALQAQADAPIRRVLDSRALGTAGKYSYALYLFHELFSLPSYDIAVGLIDAAGGYAVPIRLLVAAVGVAASFAIARLSWLLVEAPALSLKDRFPYPRRAVRVRAETAIA